ncbi:MAG: polyhydroxyalkanoate synthesis regulator DNA-binding domain-containing protein [Pseudomonadota bacterium]
MAGTRKQHDRAQTVRSSRSCAPSAPSVATVASVATAATVAAGGIAAAVGARAEARAGAGGTDAVDAKGAATLLRHYGRNRCYYDTSRSRYVTLREIAVAIAAGEVFRVVDADTGKDETDWLLLKILATKRDLDQSLLARLHRCPFCKQPLPSTGKRK